MRVDGILWGRRPKRKFMMGDGITIPPLPTPSPPFSRGERVGVKGEGVPDTNFLFRRYQPSARPLCGAGALKMSLLPSPTPYTLSPLIKGGEGRGEGGLDTRMPCPFGALLVTLYHFKSKAFLM